MVEELKQINECALTPTNYYVHLHTKPDTGELFYIGKGKGTRFCDFKGRNRFWKNKFKDLTFQYYDPTKTDTPTNIHATPQEPQRKKGTTHDKKTE